ncbi:MAG: hypothetical protein GTN81_06830 [Proteobacteria bacterium]|nr:hypothetical protein [Pseudomonadota bacterium]
MATTGSPKDLVIFVKRTLFSLSTLLPFRPLAVSLRREEKWYIVLKRNTLSVRMAAGQPREGKDD